MQIVDVETGAVLGAGQDGELLVKGPQVMQGYLDNPQATAETLDEEGWLHTGEISTNFYISLVIISIIIIIIPNTIIVIIIISIVYYNHLSFQISQSLFLFECNNFHFPFLQINVSFWHFRWHIRDFCIRSLECYVQKMV